VNRSPNRHSHSCSKRKSPHAQPAIIVLALPSSQLIAASHASFITTCQWPIAEATSLTSSQSGPPFFLVTPLPRL